VAICAECHATTQILPGESYGESDAGLFAELGEKLRGMSPTNAAQLAAELEGRNSAPPGRGLRRLIKLLPTLAILEFSVSDQPAVLRKVEGMLATLLGSIASSRSQSGMMAAVNVESQLDNRKAQ